MCRATGVGAQLSDSREVPGVALLKRRGVRRLHVDRTLCGGRGARFAATIVGFMISG